VDLGAAAEAVGEEEGISVSSAEAREEDAFGAGLADLEVAAFEAEVARRPAASRVQVFGVDACPA
jgi:hypothetical protein